MMNLTRMFQSPDDYLPPLSAEVLEDHEEMELLLEAYLQVGGRSWSGPPFVCSRALFSCVVCAMYFFGGEWLWGYFVTVLYFFHPTLFLINFLFFVFCIFHLLFIYLFICLFITFVFRFYLLFFIDFLLIFLIHSFMWIWPTWYGSSSTALCKVRVRARCTSL